MRYKLCQFGVWGGGRTLSLPICEKCPYSEFFCSAFPIIQTEYREILRISPHSVQMRENTDQNNSEYGHFLFLKLTGT